MIFSNKVISKMVLQTFAFALIAIIALPVQAQNITISGVNAQEMLETFSTNVPMLMRLVTAFAYVMGMYFIFAGILKLKHFGEARTMMSHEHSLKGPIIFLIVGTALLYLPSAVEVGMTTFWSVPCPYCYLEENDQWTSFLSNIFIVMQLFGVIAFIRGLVILSHMGGHGGHQQGTFGRAMTHIIGGIFCINIYQFVQVILVTFGFMAGTG
jgi:intracellular multiplication protein IcmC